MKRTPHALLAALLALALVLPALPAAAAPAAHGWSVATVLDWLCDWLPSVAQIGAESTADGEPALATGPDDPSTQATDPLEPAGDGGNTESHPDVDPNG